SYKNKGKLMPCFNAPLYESIMVSFTLFDRQEIAQNADKIREVIEDIKYNNNDYNESIHTGTNTKKHMYLRMEIIYNAISSVIERNNSNTSDSRYFPKEFKTQLYHDGCKCGICGQVILNINDCEIDHIIPYSKGGKTTIENAQLVHSYCNRFKGNRDL
ncbi:MAG: HNH endonuclease, partial [Ruminococcus sp.]|nr:HNH endonuclease [Ruminococcus sp.]